MSGIINGADVAEHNPTPNFTVDVSGPALVYDQLSQKIAWSTTQNIDCTIDENGSATAVTTSGNEKYLSIFAEYERSLSDPRTDRNGATVFFVQAESYKINVVQGVEAPTGTAVKPALRADQVLLGDVRITYGMTQILTANISLSRSEYPYDLTGSPLAIKEKGLQDVLQAMVDAINAFDSADITSSAISDSPSSLSSGTIFSQLTQLLAHVNDRGRLAAAESWTGKQTFSNSVPIKLSPYASPGLSTDGDLAYDSTGDDSLKIRMGGTNRIIAQQVVSRTIKLSLSIGASNVNISTEAHDWRYYAEYDVWRSQQCDGSSFYMCFPLNGIIPQGATITQIRADIQPRGSTSGSNGVYLALIRGETSVRASGYDSGSGVRQWITLSSLTELISSNAFKYRVLLRAQTFVYADYNEVYDIEATFTDGDYARVP